MIIVQGDMLEGGGQILRTATALSALSKKPCRIVNIRANRPKPGLREQHLQGLLAVAKLCNGSVKNAFVGSKEIEFYPGNIFEKQVEVSIQTAGSITLVLQSLMTAAAFARDNVEIKIKGGATNTSWSPPADYTRNVFFPLLEKTGYITDLEIKRRGFYPKGGAEIICNLKPVKKLQNICLESRGDVKVIKGVSVCSNLPESVARRQKISAENILRRAGYETEIKEEVVRSHSAGSAAVLWAECNNSVIGADALGEIKKSAENVGKEAAEKMIIQLQNGFSLDLHAADQIIPYIALAEGESSITTSEITEHVLTNIAICEKMLGVKFSVQENRISVEGCSFSPNGNI